MISLVKNTVFGVLAIVLTVVSMLVVSFALIILVALRNMLPFASVQKILRAGIEKAALFWPMQNDFTWRYLNSIPWEISGGEDIDSTKNYLVISNHQSWMDIPVLEKALYRRTGFSRYFIKKSLLKTPLVGWACAALEFPAMHRYSKSMLIKNPSLKGKDTEITKRACLRLKGIHFKLNNFAEGTRFTAEKHERQQSPYNHLLKPKAAGVSFALQLLQDQLDGILNITIVYVGEPKTILGVYFSRLKKIVVTIEKITINEDLIGNYEMDRPFRSYFQTWLNALWFKKDRLISDILKR